MLDTLRRIVQDISTVSDLPSALTLTVDRIRDTLQVAGCTIYLADPEDHCLVLAATAGLDPAPSDKIRSDEPSGLVGWVAQRQELLNLADVSLHPGFGNSAEPGGHDHSAFLGVPLIHQQQTLGVLIVQDAANRPFHAEEEDFLLTIATQLAGLVHQAIGRGAIAELLNPSQPHRASFLQGLAGAQGVAIGTIILPYFLTNLNDVPHRAADDPAAEEAALQAAIAAVDAELQAANDRLAPVLAPSEQTLFSAHRLLLASDSLRQETNDRIQAGSWAPAAWAATILARAHLLEEAADPYLSARAEDIRDLGRRVLRCLRTDVAQGSPIVAERCVLLAEEMSVADMAAVPPERLAAIVCLRGSSLSHVATLARAMGIPAVMSLGEQPINDFEGQEIIVDGYQGRVFINPDPNVHAEYERLIAAEGELTAGLDKLRELPAETLDGYRIPLYTKAGLLSDIPSASRCGADGVGLYRTEFAFMIRQSFPSEDEQFALYQQILTAFAPKPVVIRTLDIGGDKPLPYYAIDEKNPFLGWRGIRFTLDHPDIFLTQLRALLRANAATQNLRVLLPMITTVEEVDKTLQLLEQAAQQLETAGQPMARPPVGAMIEVPAAVWQTVQLARRVDFLSIGTNDLTQYLLAVDRDNARVAQLYEHLHPAMLQAIAHILAGGRQAGRPVYLSGEMAADPGTAVLLLGMGADSLNASPASVPRVKWAIRSFTQVQARELAAQALALESAGQVRRLLNDALRQAGLSDIVHEWL